MPVWDFTDAGAPASSQPSASSAGDVADAAEPPSPYSPSTFPNDRSPELDVDAFVGGMFVESRLDAHARPRRRERGFNIPGLGSTRVSMGGARFLMGGAMLIVAIMWWILSGGLTNQLHSKVAEVPVPPGSKLIATQEAITEGLMGPLDKERRAVMATRVFLVPMPLEQALEYYRTGGGGQLGLSERGWTGPDGEYTNEPTYFDGEFTRIATVGYRTEEEQTIYIRVQEQTLGWGIFELALGGQNPFDLLSEVSGAAVSGQSCIVAVCCQGSALEEVEFAEE